MEINAENYTQKKQLTQRSIEPSSLCRVVIHFRPHVTFHLHPASFSVSLFTSLGAVTGSGLLFERKGQQPGSQAEAERQQILNEMKKKTPLLTDSSWIRQRSTTTPSTKEADVPPMRR